MASKVVVHFEGPDGTPHEVVVNPSMKDLKGILFMTLDEAREFATVNKLTKGAKRGLPPELRVHAGGKDVTEEITKTGFGPGVCYMIGVQVFCW